ncbi:histidinol phosphate phosphatase H [Gonapodya prolifera JEL478]|uniref:Histidinol-phosphatase n=1 Tax=Gonapodya prolifera (strain JEL478) TaxID=1344416 RepID=A0A139AEY5_GONPJ|nr:histidinol phosphate phosphatase H [Gonapodya prolifera JEL478]|eukprot:KXS14995.1 histidinol phosphate phosphatase H [Gonapodya prolifera JEL478]
MISFHSHSGQFCRHAHGTLEEVVQSAIAKGFSVLGFSEHMPRTRMEDIYPEEVRQAYPPSGRDTERVLQAFYLGDAVRLKKDHVLEYIVGSLHHVDGIAIDFDEKTLRAAQEKCWVACGGQSTEDGTEELFRSYFDHQYEMLVALKPDVVGHFDLVRMWRRKHLLNEAEKGLLEAYPMREILEYMLTRNPISDDSHGPDQVGAHYERVYPYLRSVGVNSVYALRSSALGKVEQVERSLEGVEKAR